MKSTERKDYRERFNRYLKGCPVKYHIEKNRISHTPIGDGMASEEVTGVFIWFDLTKTPDEELDESYQYLKKNIQ